MHQKIFKAAIIGPPGSGKSTVSPRIIKYFKLQYISSGDLIRQRVLEASHPDVGKKLADILRAGKLVDDRIIIKKIMNKLLEFEGKSWILDGFPRTIHQCTTLWNLHRLDCVINLVVPMEVIVERISKRYIHFPSGRIYNLEFNAPKIAGKDDVTGEKLTQREDDTPDAVRKRIKYYESLMPPVIDFFRERGVIHDFEGRTTNEMWSKIKVMLLKHIPMMIDPEV